MGLRYANLNSETRKFMVEEIELDRSNDKIYLSPWLSQKGQGDWVDILIEAARTGTDDSLANEIRHQGRLVLRAQRRKPKGGYTWYEVPATAPLTIAEGEFNRYYIRGLCRRVIEAGIPRLEVYRAKDVCEPRPESFYKIGLLMDPEVLLTDLRSSQGVETALGMPQGPNSGLTLRIPARAHQE